MISDLSKRAREMRKEAAQYRTKAARLSRAADELDGVHTDAEKPPKKRGPKLYAITVLKERRLRARAVGAATGYSERTVLNVCNGYTKSGPFLRALSNWLGDISEDELARPIE